MNIWPRRLEPKKETRQAAISRRRVTQSKLRWNWRQTIQVLTSKIPAPDPLDMSPCPIRMRAQSFQNFSRKAILKLQDQLSQHDRCKKLNQRHLRYARRFKSTNQRIATKQTSLYGVGLWFWTAKGRDTLEQIIATVLFICISSINNKRSLLRFQSTTAPTNIACMTGALWAKRDERDISRGARHEREARLPVNWAVATEPPEGHASGRCLLVLFSSRDFKMLRVAV